MSQFDFIADPKFRSILIRDFKELESCLKSNSSKSVLILSGSIIEAVLTEFFSHNPAEGKTKAKVLKMTLSELIDDAADIELISSKSKNLSIVIKDYRNLIHPGREVRTNESFSIETANVSFNLVKIILDELKIKYVEKYGYRAEDIFSKIQLDNSTYAIYDKLLERLNDHEKIRLTQMLVDQLIEFETNNKKEIAGANRYINPLLAVITEEEIRKFCKNLVRLVERGEKPAIIAQYKIFSKYLNLLEQKERELILLYIYNIANDAIYLVKRAHRPMYSKIYSSLGLYLDSPELKEKFFTLILDIVKAHYYEEDSKWTYRELYRALLSNFDEDKISKTKTFVEEYVDRETSSEFYSGMQKDEELPF